jgi:diguanylate cyclase
MPKLAELAVVPEANDPRSDDGAVAGLRSLVAILTDSLAEFVSDDRWLQGQVMRARTLVNQPLDVQAIAEVSRGLRQAAFRQAILKANLDEAKDALKAVIALILERIGSVVETTGGLQTRIAQHARKVAAARNIGELSEVVAAILADMATVGEDVRRMQTELELARREAEERDREVTRLQQELADVSDQVRHDPLTELLNRRGLDEAARVEFARTERTGEALSVAMIDLDDFRAVNSRLGHTGGDRALGHMADVLRRSLRPTDVICRYGGEEFVVLMPHTPVAEASATMARLQGELASSSFMHEGERVFITFTAGVAEKRDGESREAVLMRADEAMLVAKSAGKNRVLLAA